MNEINSVKVQAPQFKGTQKPEEKTPQENKSSMKTSTKVMIGTGLTALAAAGIYIATRGKTKIKPDSKAAEETIKDIDKLFDESYEIMRVNEGLDKAMEAKRKFLSILGESRETADKLFLTDLSKNPEKLKDICSHGTLLQNKTKGYAQKANMISFKDGEIIYNGSANMSKDVIKRNMSEYTLDSVNNRLKYENEYRDQLLTRWDKPHYSVADALYETTSSKEFNELVDKVIELLNLNVKSVPKDIIELHNTVKGMFKSQLENRGFDMEDICRRFREYGSYYQP